MSTGISTVHVVYPVFHPSLRSPVEAEGLPGEQLMNEAESRNLRGRILERDDGTDVIVEKWEFDGPLDVVRIITTSIFVKGIHCAATQQLTTDLKAQSKRQNHYSLSSN
ncbi:hypothetical protein GQ43DRAFT_444853 [Delitschia confertaspora ATCC 74209]|uniref:Uncharacterized protein n=1 Tax=Delitschia confertaspora ATCC 74209 TaxID=1513339 RepID=A0A9P4JCH0_9PLEO|nr:hypothetical protein GQ43DRAFT_444853 [Delitschia confertaspora ATCC 74209]